ncbi:MAG: hypothetical protein P8P54_04150, partial [Pseudomonadales bacterium]|nr:hypothetical protein [Pseudomonadales bacterium]
MPITKDFRSSHLAFAKIAPTLLVHTKYDPANDSSNIDATCAGRTGEIVKPVTSSGYYQDGPMVYLQSTNVEMIRLPAIIRVSALIRLLFAPL